MIHVCEQDEKRSLEKQEEQQVENQENSIYFFLLLLLFLLIYVFTQLPGLMMSNMFISNKELPHSSSFGRKV